MDPQRQKPGCGPRSVGFAATGALVFTVFWSVSAAASVTHLADKPQTGVVLSDLEIHEAIWRLKDGDLDEQLGALERLIPYFGRHPFLSEGQSVIFHFSHEPTSAAFAELAEPRAVSLILRCLDHPDPTIKLWGLFRARRQNLLSPNTDFSDKVVGELLGVGGLVLHTNRKRVIEAVQPLKEAAEEYVRAEAIQVWAELSSGRGQPRPSHLIEHVKDASHVVRAKVWGLLGMAYTRTPSETPPFSYITGLLRKDLAADDKALVRAALGFVIRAGWIASGYMRIPSPERAAPWRRLLDRCEDLVMARLRDRAGPESHVFRACRFYPRAEPLLIEALSGKEERREIVDSLSEIGTRKSLAALRKLAGELPADDSLYQGVTSAVERMERRLKWDDPKLSLCYYTLRYIDPDVPGTTETYFKILKRHGLGGGFGSTVQLRGTAQNVHRWRILITILDSPGWRETFEKWDGADLLEGLRLEW